MIGRASINNFATSSLLHNPMPKQAGQSNDGPVSSPPRVQPEEDTVFNELQNLSYAPKYT